MIITYADGNAHAVLCDLCLTICAPCTKCKSIINAANIVMDSAGNLYETTNKIHTETKDHVCDECYQVARKITNIANKDPLVQLAKESKHIGWLEEHQKQYAACFSREIRPRRNKAIHYLEAHLMEIRLDLDYDWS